MTASDGDGLAEVIYFPGVAAPSDVVTPPSAAEPTKGPTQSTRAENIAMHALTRRGQSRRELEAKLIARDLDADTVEAELERLAGVGLIDDEALAEEIVRSGRERKGLGRAALAAELRRRKIDPMFIDSALDNLDLDSEREQAIEVAVKRADRMQSLDRETAVRRLTSFMQRKGYSGDVVRQAVSTALDARTHTVRFR